MKRANTEGVHSMKIIFDKADLSNGVQIASKAVPNNTTMSILECILIEASNGCIKMTSNDMELGIETVVKGSIKQEGSVAVVSKRLQEVVRKLPDGEITMFTDENYNVIISCGKLNITINGRSGEDFMLLPEIEKKESIELSMFTLKEAVRQTIFSIGISDTNKIMSGIHMMIKEDQLKLTSLDGHRISIRKIQLKNSYEEKEVIIPGRTLNEISKIIDNDTEKTVTIYFSDAHMIFEFENTVIISRLIDGKYFNVDRMLSSDYETKITVNNKVISDSIDRSMLFSKEGNKKPIVLNISENILNISVNSTEGGMDDEINIESSGRDIRIGFNPKFLLDAIKVIDEENIDIYFVNPKAPCYIKDANESYIYMILPVNLS